MSHLKDARLAAGLTQRALAERSECGLSSIRAMEAGKRRPNSISASRIARALGRGVDEIFPLPAPPPVSGYQQGILMAMGSLHSDGRFTVCCQDRFYPEAVQPILGCKVFFLRGRSNRPVGQWIVCASKSIRFRPLSLEDVRDWRGFCRAWIEIHGGVVSLTRRSKKSKAKYHVPGMRFYGPEHIVAAVMAHLPVSPKTIQHITNQIDGGKYVGHTCCVTLAKHDTTAVLDYIDGLPRNETVWNKWDARIESINHERKLFSSGMGEEG